jgi:hypothetical protein
MSDRAKSTPAPDEVDALKAELLAERADIAAAWAEQSSNLALIVPLKLQIEKLNRDRFGRSRHSARIGWSATRQTRPRPRPWLQASNASRRDLFIASDQDQAARRS